MGLVLAVSLWLTGATFIVPAQAQTMEELQEQINDLLTQIASLQEQLAGDADDAVDAVERFTFTQNLTLGSRGVEVTALQDYLTDEGHFTFAGGSTGFFGPITQSAVSAWQAANGVTPTAGFWGPISRAMYDALTPADVPADEPTDEPTDETVTLEGGAGSIRNADFVGTLNNEEVGEGQNDVGVAGLTIEADTGSDIMITAVELNFDQVTANQDFRRYANEVSVWVDGEEHARVDATEFEDDRNFNATVSLSSGAVIQAGETGDLVVKVSGISNLDSDDAGDGWTVGFESLRFVDAQNASVTDNSTGDIGIDDGGLDYIIVGADEVEFSFETLATSQNTEIKFAKDVDSINDARVINVDDVNDTDGVELLSFTIEIEGTGDVNLDDLPVLLTSIEATGTDFDAPGDLISRLTLTMDGVQVGSESVSGVLAQQQPGGTNTQTVTFDRMNLDLNGGQTYEFVVLADIIETDGVLDDGDRIRAEIGVDQVTAADFEDSVGDNVTNKTGTAVADEHELRDAGIMVTFVSASAVESHSGDIGLALDHDEGTFKVVFDVTAFDGDAYIDATAPHVAGTLASDYDMTGTATYISSLIDSPTATSGGSGLTAGFLVNEGTTDRFTITVVAAAGADGFFKMSIEGIRYVIGTAFAEGATSHAFNLDEFETESISLNFDAT